MAREIPGLQTVVDLVKRYRGLGIESTGAEVVNVTAGLYNVIGSTYDPKKIPGHEGENWKALLIAYGIDSNCYVSNPDAEGSHPEFSVGGHVTTNKNGSVAEGGTCYLMPLCYWHNGKKNDGVLFNHTKSRMLKLTGYMQGELAATFQLRLASRKPYAVLYYSGHGWQFQDITMNEAANLKTDFIPKIKSGTNASYVLFERVGEPGKIMHYIREASLL